MEKKVTRGSYGTGERQSKDGCPHERGHSELRLEEPAVYKVDRRVSQAGRRRGATVLSWKGAGGELRRGQQGESAVSSGGSNPGEMSGADRSRRPRSLRAVLFEVQTVRLLRMREALKRVKW